MIAITVTIPTISNIFDIFLFCGGLIGILSLHRQIITGFRCAVTTVVAGGSYILTWVAFQLCLIGGIGWIYQHLVVNLDRYDDRILFTVLLGVVGLGLTVVGICVFITHCLSRLDRK